MNQFQTLPASYWQTLDALIEGGWHPLLNWLEPEKEWHVNLTHETAPIPTVFVSPDLSQSHSEPHRYRIHGFGATLALAFDDAFRQVTDLLQSK